MDVVLHVGAGQEQQLKLLLESDVGRVVLFEPHPEYAEKIRRTYPDSPNVRVVAAAVAAEEGSHSLQEFNFPEVNSLRYPKVVKQIFTGVVRRRSQVRTITPTQMVIEHGPGYQETACLVIEAPEEAYAILQPLIENGLLDRFVELQISMTVESCNTGNASAEKAIEALRDYGFEVVQHDAQDPDSPRWVLRRTPLKLEIKKIRQELSQAKKRSQDLEKQLKEKKLAFEKLEEKFKNTHTYFMNRKKQAIELEAERKRLNKENQTLRNSLGETRAALSEKLAEIEHLKKAWAVKESEADSQRFEIKKQSEAHDVDGENNAEQYPYPEIKPVDPALQKELGIEEGEKVIGTFSPYEGLDHLLEACTELVQSGEKLKLLLVGDSQPLIGASAAHLADTGLKETLPWLIQVGRVPHEHVADYYALLDAVVIPRKPLAVCQLVPPMKAAEALAYGKRLVVSDVAPLAEYADKFEGVVSFEAGSATSLATALQRSLKLPAPKPSTELLFSAHTEPMVQALKGEGSAAGQKAVVEAKAKASKPVPVAKSQKAAPTKGTLGRRLKAISIMDEISEECWRYEMTAFPINRNNYKEQVAGSLADFCFLESCWKGNRGSWEYAFTSPGLKHANAQALLDLIPRVKKKMPLVFWNKEDPMHYDRYLPIAKSADIIFTTDETKVADYQRDVRDADVYAVPFAAQQRICNPSDRFRTAPESVCFAGSYYGVGHDERKRQMDALLPSIIEFKGAIYDRMSKIDSDRYKFPPQYAPFIRDAVPFTEVVKLYKRFKVFLNVNTIVESPTMMSRRVYELLACGTPVVSTPSKAIEEQFPGIVHVANDAQEANVIIEKLLTDEHFWEKTSHIGYREVMKKHTYTHRLKDIETSLGYEYDDSEPLVSIITCTRRPNMIDRIVENMTRQNYPNCELILVLQDFSKKQAKELVDKIKATPSNIRVVEALVNDSSDTLGERFNKAAEIAQGEYIAKMDDDDFYFENYLSDMLIPPHSRGC